MIVVGSRGVGGFERLLLGSNSREPGTWGFYLKSLSENATRLIVRSRGDWKPGLLRIGYQYGVFEPAHFIMERKMLLTIKHLAEQNTCEMRFTWEPGR